MVHLVPSYDLNVRTHQPQALELVFDVGLHDQSLIFFKTNLGLLFDRHHSNARHAPLHDRSPFMVWLLISIFVGVAVCKGIYAVLASLGPSRLCRHFLSTFFDILCIKLALDHTISTLAARAIKRTRTSLGLSLTGNGLGTYTKGLLTRLRRLSRPPIPPGHRRIEWVCVSHVYPFRRNLIMCANCPRIVEHRFLEILMPRILSPSNT